MVMPPMQIALPAIALTASVGRALYCLARKVGLTSSDADHHLPLAQGVVEAKLSHLGNSFAVFTVCIDDCGRIETTIETACFAAKKFEKLQLGATYSLPVDFKDRQILAPKLVKNNDAHEGGDLASPPPSKRSYEVTFRALVVALESGMVKVKRLDKGDKIGEYEFHIEIASTLDGYTPEVDDLLAVTITTSQLRQTVVGYRPVTIWFDASGSVPRHPNMSIGMFVTSNDESVFVFPHHLLPGNLVRDDDRAVAVAVSRKKDRVEWRAIEVRPAADVDVAITSSSVNVLTEAIPLLPNGTSALKILLSDKHGVSVLPGKNLCFVVAASESQELELAIVNHGHQDQELQSCIVKDCPSVRVREDDLPMEIPAKESRFVKLMVEFVDFAPEGLYGLVLLKFKDFSIGRIVAVNPTAITGDLFRSYTDLGHRVVAPPERHDVAPSAPPLLCLPKADDSLPLGFAKICLGEETLLTVFPCLTEPLQQSNYELKLRTLVDLQEFEERVQLSVNSRSVRGVRLQLVEGCKLLKVHLPEMRDRTSVMKNSDVAVVSQHGCKFGREFEGNIQDVKGNLLFVRFTEKFHQHYQEDMLVDVKIERRADSESMKRIYQAIEEAQFLPMDLLFPDKVDPPDSGAADTGYRSAVRFFNQTLNDAQKAAVQGILYRGVGSLPYIIFGPPGTGKTVTVAEAILQVAYMKPGSRILVVTPSNKAADVVCHMLATSGKVSAKKLVRFEANYRRQQGAEAESCCDVPNAYTTVYGGNHDMARELLSASSIVICTWFLCGSLKKHRRMTFTHVFLDEAGHMTEPETLVALTIAPHAERVVLAGDPQQLGPTISSGAARQFGLDISFMERVLRKAEPYKRLSIWDKFPYDERVLVKLTENYRSRPAIAKLFSEVFYYGDVIVPPSVTHNNNKVTPPWVDRLPDTLKNSFPVSFLDTGGAMSKTDIGDTSPFNMKECESAIWLLKCLHEAGVPLHEIGVVTPYSKQAKVIKKEAANAGEHLKGVTIGTLEEFQGYEKGVVIVSLVRSVQKFQGSFAVSPKHINVAISRAREYLVLIGDRDMMQSDPHWSKILAMIEKRG